MLAFFLSLSGLWASAAAIAFVYGIDALLSRKKEAAHPDCKSTSCNHAVQNR